MVYSLIVSALVSFGLIVGSLLHSHFSVFLLILCWGKKRIGLIAMSIVFCVMFISVVLSFLQSTTNGIINLVIYAIFMLAFYFCSNSSVVNEALGLRVPYRGIMGTALMPLLLFGYSMAILIRLVDVLGTPIAFPFSKDNISVFKIDKSANLVAYNVIVIGIGIVLFLLMLLF